MILVGRQYETRLNAKESSGRDRAGGLGLGLSNQSGLRPDKRRPDYVSTEMQWNRLVVNLWSKMSLFCSMKEGVSYLFLSATTYLLFCHVQPPPRSAVPHVCCRPSNGRKMQALTAVEWLTAVRYETDGRLANGWTDGLPENRLTGLGEGLPLTIGDE